MQITIEKNYLIIPIDPNAKSKKFLFSDQGRIVMEFDAHCGERNPQYMSYIDMKHLHGKTLEFSMVPWAHIPLQWTDMPVWQNTYSEPLRPRVHFSPRFGWTNDPDGLFWLNGMYHLFYQHNPIEAVWGNIHWGHAVSSDLLHWVETNDILAPDERGMVFSGCAYVDSENASGLRCGDDDPVLLFYTAAGGTSQMSKDKPFVQCMAYSVDGGKTFTKYRDNPVIEEIFPDNRDPKVVWAEEVGRYLLVLYLRDNTYLIMASHDLLHWEKFQQLNLGDDRERADFYPICVENSRERLWVLAGASDSYIVGKLEKTGFTPMQRIRQYALGSSCSYASHSFAFPDSRTLKKQCCRRIRIAWEKMLQPGCSFANQLSIPCEITMKKIGETYRLSSLPVREIESLYIQRLDKELTLQSGIPYRICLSGIAYDITVKGTIHAPDLKLDLFGVPIEIHARRNILIIERETIPLSYSGKTCQVRIILDTAGIEVFADDGMIFYTLPIIPDYSLACMYIESEENVNNLHLSVRRLKGIWPEQTKNDTEVPL